MGEISIKNRSRMQGLAMNFFEKKLENVPDMPKYNHCLASLKAASGDSVGALANLQVALANDPQNLMVRNDYALTLARNGDYKHSIDEFNRALLLNNDQSTIHKNIGAVYARKGNYRDAYVHARRAVQVNQSDPMAHRNIAKIQEAIGDSRSALSHNLTSISLENMTNKPKRNTAAYRAAAVQMISQGNYPREDAINLVHIARSHDGIKYVSPTTERTNEIIKSITSRKGDEVEIMEREAKRRQEILDIKNRLLQGDIPRYQPNIIKL